MEYIRTHGLSYTLLHGTEKLSERFLRTYDRKWKTIRPDASELAFQCSHPLHAGCISILIPVYQTDPGFLEALLESIQNQTYPDFEVILYVTGNRTETDYVLRRYADSDPRFRVYRGDENLGISGNTNRAAEKASGDWIALCDHDDLLSPDCLYAVARCLISEKSDVVYTDEDKITENGRVHTDAHCKPDFSPLLLLSSNYVCHFLCMRRELWDAVGGERSEYDGSQDHDLVLRLWEHTDRISHIPLIAYHWRTVQSSMSHRNLEQCIRLSCRAVQDHFNRTEPGARAEIMGDVLRLRFPVPEQTRVDLFYLTQENTPIPEVVRHQEGAHFRLIPLNIADNRFQVMNKAAAQSEADVLWFLDASVLPLSREMGKEMLMLALRPGTGAVTGSLMSPSGKNLHAGFALYGPGFAMPRQYGVLKEAGGWHILLRQTHEVSAVCALCFMISRDRFIPYRCLCQGGLENVDLCLRLEQRGLRQAYTPYAEARVRPHPFLLHERNEEDARTMSEVWGQVRDSSWSRSLHPGSPRVHLKIPHTEGDRYEESE